MRITWSLLNQLLKWGFSLFFFLITKNFYFVNKPLKNLVLFYFHFLNSLKVVRTSIMITTADSSQSSHTILCKDLSIHADSKIPTLTSSLHRHFVSLLLFLVIGLYFQQDFVENTTTHIPLDQYKCCFWNQVQLSNAINHIHLWPHEILLVLHQSWGLPPDLFSVRIIILNFQSSCLIHSSVICILQSSTASLSLLYWIWWCLTLLVHCDKTRSHLLWSLY